MPTLRPSRHWPVISPRRRGDPLRALPGIAGGRECIPSRSATGTSSRAGERLEHADKNCAAHQFGGWNGECHHRSDSVLSECCYISGLQGRAALQRLYLRRSVQSHPGGNDGQRGCRCGDSPTKNPPTLKTCARGYFWTTSVTIRKF